MLARASCFAIGHTLEPNATKTVLNTVFVLAGYLQVLAAASEGVHAYSYLLKETF